jgi:hypothetical protein
MSTGRQPLCAPSAALNVRTSQVPEGSARTADQSPKETLSPAMPRGPKRKRKVDGVEVQRDLSLAVLNANGRKCLQRPRGAEHRFDGRATLAAAVMSDQSEPNPHQRALLGAARMRERAEQGGTGSDPGAFLFFAIVWRLQCSVCVSPRSSAMVAVSQHRVA